MDEAPPLSDADTWLNRGPVRLDAVDRPVLLHIWRYADLQSRRSLAKIRQLWEQYDDQLQVVTVHSSRFSFEADPGNIEHVLDQEDVTFPVALDPENTVRRRYGAVSRPYTAVI
ncbi:MAG: hypothetical protein SVU88_02305, partial [Candidatus Nanohaloarchaea archaeon]|nr:hypothetical protein [Candidatus Nanohaloarchaea archaeon]